MIERVRDILENINPGVDYDTSTTLVDDRLLDSLTIVALVAELEDEFDVSIPTVEIMPQNFNSLAALAALMERLVEDQD